MSKPSTISLDLTQDQALVFFDWLTREGESGRLPIAHQAEQDLLWGLEGQLEKSLVEPFNADYAKLVQAARSRLTGGESKRVQIASRQAARARQLAQTLRSMPRGLFSMAAPAGSPRGSIYA